MWGCGWGGSRGESYFHLGRGRSHVLHAYSRSSLILGEQSNSRLFSASTVLDGALWILIAVSGRRNSHQERSILPINRLTRNLFIASRDLREGRALQLDVP